MSHDATAGLEGPLRAGLDELGLELGPPAVTALLAYLALLITWNRAYNLTAVREPRQMVSAHLLDSLAVLPWVRGPRVLDVGTGAGLPGIPLAIARPEWAFTLLDSSGKKTRFVTQVGIELGLSNLTVINSRVEAYEPARGFDTVISRAFASLEAMCQATTHLVQASTRLVAMKGTYPASELAALPAGVQVAGVHRLGVPGLKAERHVVLLTSTP